MAAVRRLVFQLSSMPGFGASKSKVPSLAIFDPYSISGARHFSQSIQRTQESNMDMFKAEVEYSQGHYFYRLQSETEKLKYEIKMIRNEWRYGIDKIVVENQLELGREIVKIHKALSAMKDEIYNKRSKNYREINTLRGELGAVKFDCMKYIGILIFLSLVLVLFFP